MKAYIVEQKITVLANQYLVYEIDQSGQKSNLVAFAQQKRLAFKEEINFYTDDTKSSIAFSVKAEKVMDIHGRFLVKDKEGKPLGAVKKVFGSSFLRSTWEVFDSKDAVAATVTEKSAGLAIFRRVWGFIPFISELPFFFKYDFVFLKPGTQDVLANYIKTTRFRDHYRLEILNDGLIGQVGWQTLVAQAVMLDALQGR